MFYITHMDARRPGTIERDVATLRNATSVQARPWAQPDQRRDGSASSSAVYSARAQPTAWKTIGPKEMGKGSTGKKGVTWPNPRRSARQQPHEAARTRDRQPAP
jgi:hypothetical protein